MADKESLRGNHPSAFMHRRKAGIGNVGSYQVSGIPFLTGALTIENNHQHKISFPSVAKQVTVVALDGDGDAATVQDLQISFAPQSGSNPKTDTGDGAAGTFMNYFTLSDTKDSMTFTVKCKEIYIFNADAANDGDTGAYQVYAELTGIPVSDMPPLTGSGITK